VEESESPVATLRRATWSPPAPMQTIAGVFPDTFEVQVFSTVAGMKLVAAVELVSPGNKDRHEERRGFAIKCASYLQQGVSVAIIDIVTNLLGAVPATGPSRRAHCAAHSQPGD
jgi:hypothetical protein